MRINRIIALVIVTATCLLGVVRSSTNLRPSQPGVLGEPSVTAQDFRWQGSVAPGSAIEIIGIFGNIRAEATSGSEVEVVATKHARRSNPDEVEIRTVKHNGGVTICAVYPRGDAGEPNQCAAGGGSSHTHNNDVRVDFTVRVPADVRLIARTVDGDIEATSLSGNVDASSVQGSIRISTTGYAQARTVTGSITAALGNSNWVNELEFETITGEINLSLPAKLNTEFHAESISGAISTEFPLTIQGSMNRQVMNGTIGNGGRKLSLKTISGAIKLMRAT